VCLFVYLSVRESISGNIGPIFTNFVRVRGLLMAVAQSSSGDVAIYYAVPVLSMTSYLRDMSWRI